MSREDPLAELVALGRAAPGTTFSDLLEAGRPALERLVPSTSMNAQWLAADHRPRGVFAHVVSADDLRDYVAEYWKTDPMTPQALLRSGRAITLSSSAPRKVIEQTPYWNDLLVPMGLARVVGVTCALPGSETFMLASHRPRRLKDFTHAEARRWDIGGAELARAVAALAFRERASGEETCGVLLFDCGGQLLHADEGGGALFARVVALGRGPYLASLVRETAARTRPARDRLARLRLDGSSELHLRLSVARGVASQAVVAAALSLEVDPAARVERRARLLGLSPREASVAACVARGLSNREIADALGVRPVTVRDHLRRAFATLGVASRTELVARLLELEAR